MAHSSAASSVLRQQVLRSYRLLLRQQQVTFKNDRPTLSAARTFTRHQYMQHKALDNESEIRYLIQNATDAAKYLATNVVQAVQHGNKQIFELQLDPSVHELNDNALVKKPYVKQKRQPCVPSTKPLSDK